jgi:hypothetical protein
MNLALEEIKNDYPSNIKPPLVKKTRKLVTAKLSTTDETTNCPVLKAVEEQNSSEQEKGTAARERQNAAWVKARGSEVLNNPCRVPNAQESVISFFDDSWYMPALLGRNGDIILLHNFAPDAPEEYL